MGIAMLVVGCGDRDHRRLGADHRRCSRAPSSRTCAPRSTSCGPRSRRAISTPPGPLPGRSATTPPRPPTTPPGPAWAIGGQHSGRRCAVPDRPHHHRPGRRARSGASCPRSSPPRANSTRRPCATATAPSTSRASRPSRPRSPGRLGHDPRGGRVAARPAATWLGPVDSARTDLLAQMRSLGKTLHSATLASQVAPSMLGIDGTKRYFVAFQNDAEARGTGGLPGAFGIVRATHGKISFERFESDSALSQVKSGLELRPGLRPAVVGRRAVQRLRRQQRQPALPYAARIWLAMWQAKTHERLDGALAVDPRRWPTCSRSPARRPCPTTPPCRRPTSSSSPSRRSNPLPERDRASARKRYLLDVARAVSTKVTRPTATRRRWSRRPGGPPPNGGCWSTAPTRRSRAGSNRPRCPARCPSPRRRSSGCVVNNDAGNKLDYYLQRSITWTPDRLRQHPRRHRHDQAHQRRAGRVAALRRLRNDHPPYPTKPGDNRLGVYYYATRAPSGSPPSSTARSRRWRRAASRGTRSTASTSRCRGGDPDAGVPYAGARRQRRADRAQAAARGPGAGDRAHPELRQLIGVRARQRR